MDPTQVCPSEDELSEFALGHDPAAGLRHRIAAHVDACATCRSWLVDARKANDFFADLRGLYAPADPDSGPPPMGNGTPTSRQVILGQDIPGYDIQEQISSISMGVVYRAVQLSTKQTVAIKIIRDGPFAAPVARRRFEREVELMGQLDHPGIVRVLDSGLIRGQYFLAMQFVDGRSLKDYLESGSCTLTEKLELFVGICDAISHAHARTVLHRDIKPSNILIDAAGRPCVIDFGLAKTMDARVTDETQLSTPGGMIGSLPYMSPEHASGDAEPIDARSDVYSLGVVLYEMITGTWPYEVAGPLDQAVFVIRNQPPADPPGINGDLRAIVFKALAKDPGRRYQTVDALASDMRNYLSGRPVAAKPDSMWYHLRKAVGRHRFAATATAAFIVLLATFAITVSLLALGLQRRNYTATIALAATALDEHMYERAQRLLEQSPSRLRGWEWDRLWRLSDQAETTLEEHAAPVQRARFASDGTAVVSGDRTGKVFIHNVPAQGVPRQFEGHQANITALAVQPHGPLVATADSDRRIVVWHIDTLEEQWSAQRYTEVFAFSPDGHTLAAGAYEIVLYDAATGEEQGPPLRGLEQKAKALQFTPDGTRLIAVCNGGAMHIWNLGHDKPTTIQAHGDHATALAVSLDGTRFATGGRDKLIRVWDIASLTILNELVGHDGEITSLAWSPDSRFIISGSMDHSMRMWDAYRGVEITRFGGHGSQVFDVAFSPDGQSIVSACNDGRVRLWAYLPTPVDVPLHGHWKHVFNLAWSSDGTQLLSCSTDRTVRVWNISTGFERLVLRGHTDSVVSATWLNDDSTNDIRKIASVSQDRHLIIWDADTGLPLLSHTLAEHSGHEVLAEGQEDAKQIRAMCSWNDGKWLVTAERGGWITVWDADDGSFVDLLGRHGESFAHAVITTPSMLVSAGDDDRIVLWDRRTLAQVRTIKARQIQVKALALYNNILASGGADGTVCLWNLNSGAELGTLEGHTSEVYAVSWFAEGTRLATAGLDGTLRIWNATSGAELLVFNVDTYIQTIAAHPDGDIIASGHESGAISLWSSAQTAWPFDVAARDRVLSEIDSLYDQWFTSEAVVSELAAGTTALFPAEAEAAIQLATVRGTAEYRLREHAWMIVRFAGRTDEAYQRAFAMAQALDAANQRKLVPRPWLWVAAQLRTGRLDDAFTTLCPQPALDSCIDAQTNSYASTFLALVLHGLGDMDGAGKALARSRVLVEGQAVNDELIRLLHEAAERIEGER